MGQVGVRDPRPCQGSPGLARQIPLRWGRRTSWSPLSLRLTFSVLAGGWRRRRPAGWVGGDIIWGGSTATPLIWLDCCVLHRRAAPSPFAGASSSGKCCLLGCPFHQYFSSLVLMLFVVLIWSCFVWPPRSSVTMDQQRCRQEICEGKRPGLASGSLFFVSSSYVHFNILFFVFY
jgi:hypothetical protein